MNSSRPTPETDHSIDTLVVTVGDQPAPLWASVMHWRPRNLVLVGSSVDTTTGRDGTVDVAQRIAQLLKVSADLNPVDAVLVADIGGRPQSLPEVRAAWDERVAPALRAAGSWALDTTGGTPAMVVVAAIAHDEAGLGSELRSWVDDSGIHLESGQLVDVARPTIPTLLALHGFRADALRPPHRLPSAENGGQRYEQAVTRTVAAMRDVDGTPFFEEVYHGAKVAPRGANVDKWSDIDTLARRGPVVVALEAKSTPHLGRAVEALGWHTAVPRLAFGVHTLTGWVLNSHGGDDLARYLEKTPHGKVRTERFTLPAVDGRCDETHLHQFEQQLRQACLERLSGTASTEGTALPPRGAVVPVQTDPAQSRSVVVNASSTPGTARSALAVAQSVRSVVAVRTPGAVAGWRRASADGDTIPSDVQLVAVDLARDLATAAELQGALDAAARAGGPFHVDVTGGLKPNGYRLAVLAARAGVPVTVGALASGEVTSTTGWRAPATTSIHLPGYALTTARELTAHPAWKALASRGATSTAESDGPRRRTDALLRTIAALRLDDDAPVFIQEDAGSVWAFTPPVIVQKGWARIALLYPHTGAKTRLRSAVLYRNLAYWTYARFSGPLTGALKVVILPAAPTPGADEHDRVHLDRALEQFRNKIDCVPTLSSSYAVWDWLTGDDTALALTLLKWGVKP